MDNADKKELARTKFESLCRDYIPRNINGYRIEWQVTREDGGSRNSGCIVLNLRICGYGKYSRKVEDRTLSYTVMVAAGYDIDHQINVPIRNDLRSDLFNWLKIMNQIRMPLDTKSEFPLVSN